MRLFTLFTLGMGTCLLAACQGSARSAQGERAPVAAAVGEGGKPVAATDPHIAYVGRFDRNAVGGPLMGFVGASVRVRFRGTGLALRLKDFGGGTEQSTNYYDVSVDGAAPTLLETSPSRELYGLANRLPEGVHEVELFKRVEASPGGNRGAGRGQILGFELQGTELLPVALPARRLELVGDSITCGYGNEVSTMHPESTHYTTRHSNGHKAFGAITAALLGAQYSAVAYSGRGMSRNYAGAGGELVPDFYDRSLPDDSSASAWDHTAYVPDAVIVNLGTNDFSTPGVDRQVFVANYERFLIKLRGYYPKAALVAVLGPLLSDHYPPGAMAWTNARSDVTAAVTARRQAGDENVHLLFFEPQSPPVGEDWHPTAATHEKMARILSAELRRILAW